MLLFNIIYFIGVLNSFKFCDKAVMTHFHPFNLTAWLGLAETCVISIMSLSWMHFSLYHCTLVLFCNKNKSNVHISAPQNCNPLYHFHFLVHNQLILAQLWRNSCLIFLHRLPVFLMSFITASLKNVITVTVQEVATNTDYS